MAPKVCLLAAIGLMMAGSAQAQVLTSKTHCGWNDGFYSCSSRTETPRATIDTICGSGGIDSACSTITTPKKIPYHGPAREDFAFSPSDEARKADVRKASGYRDPPGTQVLR